MKTILFLLGTLISVHALAQDSVVEVTDSQIAFYQLGMETGCKDAGRSKGDPTDKVEAFCICMMKVLKDGLTHTEWQKAYTFSSHRQGREEMQVIGPHMRKVQACRN